MIHHIKTMKYGFAGLLLAILLGISGPSCSVNAQTSETNETNKDTVATKRAGGRDPFKKFQPPRIIPKRTGLLIAPSIEERIAQYKAQKLAAMNARMPAPKPTTALLLREIQVVGITHTPRGYAAIVEATPIKLSYVIYPGENFFDGQLVAIEEGRLVFRRDVLWTDGKRERTVEIKPLRVASPVEAMTAAKQSNADMPAGSKAETAKSETAKPEAAKPNPEKQ